MSDFKTQKVLAAGFGGQGILFAGKFLVYTGMINNREVSWLPSYGPEMRGGTANCSVIISDKPIGSPIVTDPNLLIAMNLPSLDKYEDTCQKNAKIIIDSSLIQRKVIRDDVEGFYIPATSLAESNDLKGLANMIIIGKAIKETGICAYSDIEKAMKKTVSERKKALFDANLKAVDLGYNYE